MITTTNRTDGWDDLDSICVLLIVDDSETDRATYRRYLESSERFGCSILDCESAEDALMICERNCPSLILLDYLLPGTNGLEFLQELSERVETLPPTIMLTGQGNEAVAVEAMKLGVKDYLVKGQITPPKLVNAVTNALNQQRLQAQLDRQHQQQDLFARIAIEIGDSIAIADILHIAVDGVRELLDVDRAIVYRLSRKMGDTVISESASPQWSSGLGDWIDENCVREEHSYPQGKYLDGHNTLVISNIETANLTPCYMEMLQQYQVQALVVVPILVRDVSSAKDTTVWGLLIAHHCRATRIWKSDELSLLDRLSIQMAIAIQQAELVSDLQATLEKQQEIEQQLRERVIEIDRANRAKDDFLSNLSHELRNPLTAIIGWAQLLQSGKLKDEASIARGLETIYRSAKAQSQLIEDLLDIDRITSGKLLLDPLPLDLVAVVNAAIDAVHLRAVAKSIQIGSQLISTTIVGDVDRLNQVMCNLLTNAIKFTPTGGRVEISLAPVQDRAEIRVSDNGIGISAELLPQIFDRFRQGDSNPNKASQGLGLGLSIVRQIVQLHHGTVRAESPGIGQGTTLIVQLPLAAVVPAAEIALATAVQPLEVATQELPSLAGLQILAVDDDPDILELIKYILQDLGARVTGVTSTRAAISALTAPGNYDALLVDIGMPEEDGFVLIRQVRTLDIKAGGQIPAAAITAYASDRQRRLVLAAGFQLHLAKPIDATKLIQMVAHLTGVELKSF
jgi:signal transduction histidine kinase/CheY-like chemotaxis protein